MNRTHVYIMQGENCVPLQMPLDLVPLKFFGSQNQIMLLCQDSMIGTTQQAVWLNFNPQEGWSFTYNHQTFDQTRTSSKQAKINKTALDPNNKLLMNASNEPFIQLYDLSKLDQEPYYITTGSRTVKSYISDPDFEGVSRIAVTSSKVVCALGNIIRVYSFDILISGLN